MGDEYIKKVFHKVGNVKVKNYSDKSISELLPIIEKLNSGLIGIIIGLCIMAVIIMYLG